MASQYVLAKRDYFNSLLGAKESPAKREEGVTATVQEISPPKDLVKESVTEIIDLLPKTYRSRAAALLRMLQSKLKIGDTNMLVMTHDGQEFENLYDLLFWLFTSTNIVRVQRPTNAFDFIQSLVILKIPQRLLATKDVYVRKVQRTLAKLKRKRR